MSSCCKPQIWHRFFKAAGDAHRLKILLAIKKHKAINETDIVKLLGLSQPAVAHHLAILKKAEIVVVTKVGREARYEINRKVVSDCCLGFTDLLSK